MEPQKRMIFYDTVKNSTYKCTLTFTPKMHFLTSVFYLQCVTNCYGRHRDILWMCVGGSVFFLLLVVDFVLRIQIMRLLRKFVVIWYGVLEIIEIPCKSSTNNHTSAIYRHEETKILYSFFPNIGYRNKISEKPNFITKT